MCIQDLFLRVEKISAESLYFLHEIVIDSTTTPFFIIDIKKKKRGLYYGTATNK